MQTYENHRKARRSRAHAIAKTITDADLKDRAALLDFITLVSTAALGRPPSLYVAHLKRASGLEMLNDPLSWYEFDDREEIKHLGWEFSYPRNSPTVQRFGYALVAFSHYNRALQDWVSPVPHLSDKRDVRIRSAPSFFTYLSHYNLHGFDQFGPLDELKSDLHLPFLRPEQLLIRPCDTDWCVNVPMDRRVETSVAANGVVGCRPPAEPSAALN